MGFFSCDSCIGCDPSGKQGFKNYKQKDSDKIANAERMPESWYVKPDTELPNTIGMTLNVKITKIAGNKLYFKPMRVDAMWDSMSKSKSNYFRNKRVLEVLSKLDSLDGHYHLTTIKNLLAKRPNKVVRLQLFIERTTNGGFMATVDGVDLSKVK